MICESFCKMQRPGGTICPGFFYEEINRIERNWFINNEIDKTLQSDSGL
jgi:hypothetical protein